MRHFPEQPHGIASQPRSPGGVRKKVAHLTSVHVPYDNRILHKQCRSLAKRGYEVVLLAPDEGRNGSVEGVPLRALRPPRNRVTRLLRTVPDLFKAAIREDASLYHFHDPELIGVGLALKAMGKKVVYDVHEDLPRQVLSKEYIAYPLRRAVSAAAALAEAVAARTLDGIVVANPEVMPRFPADKAVLVQNYPVLDELVRHEAIPYRERQLRAVYVGSITGQRGMVEMIRAMEELRGWPEARLILGGTFAPASLIESARRMEGWERVDYRGFLSRPQVVGAMGEARVGLAVLHPVPNYTKIQPTKLFEYMAAAIPIITSELPAWRSIIEAAECGMAVDPRDPAKIAGAIEWVFSHPEQAEQMGRRGREYALRNFSWDAEAEKLFDLYDRLLMEQRRDP
jgi:glycosyltransferase involved in cell wall biosynthesis